jgi:ligand-binding sensor domain-containing protein/two-component sensor histidine kinase
MRHIFCVLLTFFSCCTSNVFCQSENTVIVKKYTQKDGLSSYHVRKIIQDKWGFIWIATQDGICRFDGSTFVNYSKNSLDLRKISGSEVREVIEDTAGNLIWALSAEGGVDAINSITGKVERRIKVVGSSKEDYNLSMLKYNNELWVGSSTGVQILDCTRNVVKQFLPVPENMSRSMDFAARSIFLDEYKNIWVCYGGYGIVIYHATTKAILKSIKILELNPESPVSELRIPQGLFLKNGEVLLATGQGLRKISYNRHYKLRVDPAPCEIAPELNQKNINWISPYGKNSILISGHSGLYRLDRSMSNYQVLKEVSRPSESNWLSSVLCTYQDQTGNIWLGCQEGLGYIKSSKSPFEPYSHELKMNIKLDHVFTVSPFVGDAILVGLRNGLIKIQKNNNHYLVLDKEHWYRHILIDSKGLAHLYRSDGLYIYTKSKIIPIHKIYPEFLPYTSYLVNSHLFISDTLIVLGTENNKGIITWNPVKKTIRSIDIKTSPSLASSIVNNIFKDRLGRIWVLSDYVITILSADLRSKKEIELKESKTGNPYGLFFDMCEADGSYYIASYSYGILEVDQNFVVNRTFNTAGGLSNDGVYQIYALQKNKLLVTSNNGLSRIDIKTSKIQKYYLNDGLHSNAFEEVSGLMMDRKIYAGGVNGFTIVDPAAFSTNRIPPKLYFTGVEMKTATGTTDTSNIQMKAIKVPNNVIQTTIRFSGLNYTNPERIEYAYRITEESSNWIENGNQAFLPLISHEPGNYTLEVRAANEEGIYSESIKLQLYFQPKWYQTWWFKILIASLTAFIIYQYYRIRIRRLEQEHSIRQHLASDLHDDLGSTMNSINIYTNLAIMEYGTNRYLNNIKQGAQESITSIRDIIWILDDQNDTAGQLAERIYQFANPLCEANQNHFNFSIEQSAKSYFFQKEEKRNLYMVVKEAINNSMKYAEAKNISLSITLAEKKLQVIISDDGIGFDLTQSKRGNGLNNMERRAREINYRFDLTSSPSTGTKIHLIRI